MSDLAVKRATFRDFLQKHKSQLELVLPRHLTPERMLRLALSATSRNPKLLQCAPSSFALALLNAAACGLEPDGYLGHLVPFANKRGVTEAQFIPDYKGLVSLAYRSGLVRRFMGYCVHERDEFAYQFGSKAHVTHTPSRDKNPGPLAVAWAEAELTNGGYTFVVLHEADVARRRDRSQAYQQKSGPWFTDTEAMWKKSAAKELSKWIPRSTELTRAVALDDQHEIGVEQALPDGAELFLSESSEPEPVTVADLVGHEEVAAEGKLFNKTPNAIEAGY